MEGFEMLAIKCQFCPFQGFPWGAAYWPASASYGPWNAAPAPAAECPGTCIAPPANVFVYFNPF